MKDVVPKDIIFWPVLEDNYIETLETRERKFAQGFRTLRRGYWLPCERLLRSARL